MTMQGKIALEEHFAIEDTLMDSKGYLPDYTWEELKARILDIEGRRIEEMDRWGIELMILSLNAPAVQAIWDRQKAYDIARKSNDMLAEWVQRNSGRFRGFAALPMQDVDMACAEMERCVKELGFVGALVNGFSQIDEPETAVYYDLPQYKPFWKVMADLDVPFYLHPRNPLKSMAQIYDGHPWLLGPTWAFGQETAVHSLRLMASGLFDDHPNLQIVLGHMGEGLPYSMWRVDNRNKWTNAEPAYPAKQKLAHYFENNFYITTSGNFRTQTLIDAMLEIGSDRILFSADWPFENIDHAAEWFDVCAIAEADRQKIGRDNSMRLFRIDI
jgi:predicted TIM-barrel fold metal-dependent hydrolase